MEIKLLRSAQKEIDEAYTYYESKSKGLGTEFLGEVLRIFKNIKQYPEAWPVFSRRTRRCLSPKFPYGVIYQLRGEDVLIIAIAHLHRKPEYWKDRL